MAIGKVYDSSEVGRLNDFLNIKTTNLNQENNNAEATKKRVLQYSVLAILAIGFLVGIKVLVKK